MIVTTQPMALPGTCIMCPGSVRRLYVDTEVQIEWHGAVYICDECIKHMGHLIGMITQQEKDILVTTLTEKDEENYELRKQLAALEGVRDALVAGGWLAPDDPRVLAVSHADDEGPRELSSAGDDRSEGRAQDEGSDLASLDGAPSESLHDEVMARLRPDAASGRIVI